MGSLVTYDLTDGIATITMDDGKVNALSLALLTEVGAALDRAEADGAVVVLTGREGRFSAGFDLNVLRAGGPDADAMVRAGFDLSLRMLEFPRPIVIACSGHTIAMAVFLLLSGDYRIAADGPYRVHANEVALGITMPWAAIEICRQRLAPAAFDRAIILAEPFSPADALAAGFVDRVVEAAALQDAAREVAAGFAGLDMGAHAASKLRVRQQALTAIRAGIAADAGQPLVS